MSHVALITGGCRSGKSAFAVSLARRLHRETVFLATCIPGDDEMRARVAAHRAERPREWRLREEGYEPSAVLDELTESVVIVDCIPTWIANLLVRGDSDGAIEAALEQLIRAISQCRARVALIVSAEVGAGLTPETPIGRRFRDATGIANQRLAAVAARVYCMTAGLPTELRPLPLNDIANDVAEAWK